MARLNKRKRGREQGVRGIKQNWDSTPTEREPLRRSGGIRPMFRSAPQQGSGVISPRSLPPTKSLFVEKGKSLRQLLCRGAKEQGRKEEF
jgi:hypothetical protein